MSNSIVVCCSQRFRKPMMKIVHETRVLADRKGRRIEILEPVFEDRPEEFLSATEHERMQDESYRKHVGKLVFEHLMKKLKPADRCWIFNLNGYIGANTLGELFASAALEKICYAYDERMLMGKYPDELYEEPSAKELITGIIKTPEELFQLSL